MSSKSQSILYKTSYHRTSLIMLYSIIAIMTILPLYSYWIEEESGMFVPFLICWGCAGLVWWVAAKTYYLIDDTHVKYFCGPFRGKIEISKIRKIEYHDGWYIPTYKIGMDKKGVVIYYNKFDDIFLSPLELDDFIHKIMEKNPQVLKISKNN